MKEYTCVQVGHHKNIAETIEEWPRNGWGLHTYACAGPMRRAVLSIITCRLKEKSSLRKLTYRKT